MTLPAIAWDRVRRPVAVAKYVTPGSASVNARPR
jgi:hypothetical protein